MNSAISHRRWIDKPAYAVVRMCAAIERLVEQNCATERVSDAAWSVAWAVAAGATPPGYFKLRPGHLTPYDKHVVLASRRQKWSNALEL